MCVIPNISTPDVCSDLVSSMEERKDEKQPDSDDLIVVDHLSLMLAYIYRRKENDL